MHTLKIVIRATRRTKEQNASLHFQSEKKFEKRKSVISSANEIKMSSLDWTTMASYPTLPSNVYVDSFHATGEGGSVGWGVVRWMNGSPIF
ncbi:hypothetical protein CEXT_648571 [Caerostris extrusa]|uniref:Uncharacterized protein n=1 Tax=Caerostris extrusa TaxID=172846 RepID=A0AAV4N7K2_CAEEX|nr:hypothetical protein CEXT_648571 [Caerostris extrusa]